jgi:hypothetical protein
VNSGARRPGDIGSTTVINVAKRRRGSSVRRTRAPSAMSITISPPIRIGTSRSLIGAWIVTGTNASSTAAVMNTSALPTKILQCKDKRRRHGPRLGASACARPCGAARLSAALDTSGGCGESEGGIWSTDTRTLRTRPFHSKRSAACDFQTGKLVPQVPTARQTYAARGGCSRSIQTTTPVTAAVAWACVSVVFSLWLILCTAV